MLTRALILSLLVTIALPGMALQIATEGAAQCKILLAADPSPAEQTAADELALYLGRITGGEFAVSAEADGDGPAIYVGPTEFAAAQGVDCAALGADEWVIRTVEDGLILAGGRPRGTLYAVYRLLEEHLGVHWWNPWEETVPERDTLAVDVPDLTGTPVITYRDIYMLYGHDGGRFAARNRLNREGDATIDGKWGGGMDYGPPYHVHTFEKYVPPAQYFETHPEWYSLIDGERNAKHTQLCLTNPELRAFMAQRLREYIESSRAAAAQRGAPAPVVFSVSQNDWNGQCMCDECQAIAEAEEAEAGVLLDFINYLADDIKDDYPDVFIDTLAYMYTQKAPKTIKARDNVIIRLCDTLSNTTLPLNDPENADFREHIQSWARVCNRLRVWDYAVTYAAPQNLPAPTVHTYGPDFRFYSENNVEGVFTELEYPITADTRDLKVWMMMKLLEDPYRDYETLLGTFTDGFFGPAGGHIRDYLAALEQSSREHPSYVGMGPSPSSLRYLTLDFVHRAHGIFDEAEAAVAGDETLLRRVRHARLSLDRATVIVFPRLLQEWMAQGNAGPDIPIDRDAVAARLRDTWYAQADLRIPEDRRQADKDACEAEIARYTLLAPVVTLPEKFRHLPAGTVRDFTADTSRNWQDIVRVVRDPEAQSGATNRLEFPNKSEDHPVEKYALPMPWGVYEVRTKKGLSSRSIRAEDVPGPGYHWYKLPGQKIRPSCYLYFFWSWIIQVDIDAVSDPNDPEKEFDIWARIKFEGPAFPHGRAEDQNAICVERVVITEAGAVE